MSCDGTAGTLTRYPRCLARYRTIDAWLHPSLSMTTITSCIYQRTIPHLQLFFTASYIRDLHAYAWVGISNRYTYLLQSSCHAIRKDQPTRMNKGKKKKTAAKTANLKRDKKKFITAKSKKRLYFNIKTSNKHSSKKNCWISKSQIQILIKMKQWRIVQTKTPKIYTPSSKKLKYLKKVAFKQR